MDRKDAINLLFSDLIEVHKKEEYYIAIDQLTHLVAIGKTQDESIINLKNTILIHFDTLKKMLETTKIEYHFKRSTEL